jgi:hypothetical protein
MDVFLCGFGAGEKPGRGKVKRRKVESGRGEGQNVFAFPPLPL